MRVSFENVQITTSYVALEFPMLLPCFDLDILILSCTVSNIQKCKLGNMNLRFSKILSKLKTNVDHLGPPFYGLSSCTTTKSACGDKILKKKCSCKIVIFLLQCNSIALWVLSICVKNEEVLLDWESWDVIRNETICLSRPTISTQRWYTYQW
jgi:hypothetical protein